MFDYLRLIYYLFRPKTIFVRKRSGALGDDLLMSLVLPSLKKKYPKHKLIVEARWTELFKNNPYVDWVTDKHLKTTHRHFKPKYSIDENSTESIYMQFMKSLGFGGVGWPQLYLSDKEINEIKTKYGQNYIVICPHGKQKFSANRKEWGLGKFQDLIKLMSDFDFVQIGLKDDPLLDDVIDARGTAIRESAALIKNSLFFIGLEGGLMHLAKAVGKKSAIIYGGFINPQISKYEENLNIVNLVDCSPCFHSSYKHTICEHMKCMESILPIDVNNKIREKFKNELEEIKNEN